MDSEQLPSVWQVAVPLPPQYLSSNNPTASPGMRMAKAAAAAEYKAICTDIFNACPHKGAKFVIVSQHWFCVANKDYKIGPARGKTIVSKSRRKHNPYMPTDVFNALASCKTMIDAIPAAGIVPDDTAQYISAGRTDLWRTQQCRAAKVTEPHILVTLEIYL